MMRPLDSREWLEAQRLIALAAGDHASFDHATALLGTLDQVQPWLDGEDTATSRVEDITFRIEAWPGEDFESKLGWGLSLVDELQTLWAAPLADLADTIRTETEQATDLRETIRVSLAEAGLIERADQPDYPTLESLVRMVLPGPADDGA